MQGRALVAFTKYEPSLNHPLIGYDGPIAGAINDRSWKIQECAKRKRYKKRSRVIDDRLSNVLLTRFPDRKPTLVHADPKIRSSALTACSSNVRSNGICRLIEKNADDFHEVVQHYGQRRIIDEQLRFETELHDFDGTAAIMTVARFTEVRSKLLRQVVKFRLGEKAVARGMFSSPAAVLIDRC